MPGCEQLPFYRQSMGLEEAPYVHVALGNKRILTKIFENRIIVQLFYCYLALHTGTGPK